MKVSTTKRTVFQKSWRNGKIVRLKSKHTEIGSVRLKPDTGAEGVMLEKLAHVFEHSPKKVVIQGMKVHAEF
jgi:hypothetical protein